MSEEPERKTMFHGAFQYLERIHEILEKLNVISLPNPNLHGATIQEITLPQHLVRFSLLKVLFRELYPKMNAKEKGTHLKQQADTQNYSDEIQRGRTSGHNLYKFINYMNDWELELRNVTEIKGLLMPGKASVLDEGMV